MSPKGVYPHTHLKPKVYPEEMVNRVRELYIDHGLSQVEVAAELGVTQKVIYRLMVNHQIPRRPQIKRNQTGENNSSWRGEDAGYQAFHLRVATVRGKPSYCAACETTDPDKRHEWANLTGRYEDVNDYIRMCVGCHRVYDAARRAATGERTSPARRSA